MILIKYGNGKREPKMPKYFKNALQFQQSETSSIRKQKELSHNYKSQIFIQVP